MTWEPWTAVFLHPGGHGGLFSASNTAIGGEESGPQGDLLPCASESRPKSRGQCGHHEGQPRWPQCGFGTHRRKRHGKKEQGPSSLKIPPTRHLTKGEGRRGARQQSGRRLSPGPVSAAGDPGTGRHRTSLWERTPSVLSHRPLSDVVASRAVARTGQERFVTVLSVLRTPCA